MSAFTWPPDSGDVAAPVPGEGASASAPVPAAPAQEIPAAVLVPLFLPPGAATPQLVLTRRRADLRRHAGEISFPGGRRDPQDASLEDTALREAEEEIGLAREHVRVLGELPATSTFATGYVIHPYVATIPAGLAWRLSAREVDAVLELGLDAIRAGRGRTRMQRRGFVFDTDTYTVGENLIWGATARIIEHLLERLDTTGAAEGRLAVRQGTPPGEPDGPP